ncbi:hypothetical protein [Hymenobacter tenuis]
MSDTQKKSTAAASPELAAGHVRVTDKETSLEHDLPKATWDLLGAAGQKGFTKAGSKPADLS